MIATSLIGRPAVPRDDQATLGPVRIDLGTHGAETLDHRLGVVGVQGVREGARAVGERGADQGPVR